jgi:hypothetical protein
MSVSHASNAVPIGISSSRFDTGGPPMPMTGEPDELLGSHRAWVWPPNSTTSGKPNAAAACAGPVSTEIMLCADAHNASNRPIGNSAANTAVGKFTAA